MNSGPLIAKVAAVRAAYAELAAEPIDAATHSDLLAALNELEALTRQLPTVSHRILARLHREASPVALGAKNLTEVLVTRLRISRGDARRRMSEAARLGPRTALTGEALAPTLARVAAAQASGAIGSEHVRIITGFFAHLPTTIDLITREQAEQTLVDAAVGLNPDDLRKAADRLMAYLDQDGPAPDDGERARRRFLSLGRQRCDGMSPISGLLDPQARATFEAWQAKLAGPGMCNPDDENPWSGARRHEPRWMAIPARRANAPMTG